MSLSSSLIKFDQNGGRFDKITYQNGDTIFRWFNEVGDLHRDNDEPAEIVVYGDGTTVQKWYSNGKLNRPIKPAAISKNPDGTTYHAEWWLNGVLQSGLADSSIRSALYELKIKIEEIQAIISKYENQQQ